MLKLFLALFLLACNPGGLDPVETEDSVVAEDLVGLLVQPDRVILPVGTDVRLEAIGLLEGRTSRDMTAVVEWVSEDPSVAAVEDGLDQEGVLTAETVGVTTVHARHGEVASPSVSVTVTDAQLLGLTLDPSEVTLEVGGTLRVKAEAAFSDGSRSDASGQVLWAVADPQVATIEGGGTMTAQRAGTTSISASWEGVESEAASVAVVAEAKPDLRIRDIQAEPGAGEVTLGVVVENVGEVGASDFWVDVFWDPPAEPSLGALGDQFEPVTYLGPGDERTVSFVFAAGPGEYTVWAVADTDGFVEESDTSNNALSRTVTVGAAGKPNLVITTFEYYADATHILYAVDVYNAGAAAASPFFVDLWIDSADDPTDSGLGDDFVHVEGLAPGSTVGADFLVEVAELSPELLSCTFGCMSWVMADTNHEVDESSQDGNVDGPLLVTVPEP